MKSRYAMILLVLLFVSPHTVGQASSPLGSKAKSQLKKQLTKLARAKKEEAQEKATRAILRFGKHGVTFLSSLTLKEKQQAALNNLKETSDHILGLDIIKKGGSVKENIWACSYLSFGEIVLLKKGDSFAGFQIHETPDAASGTLTYSWWGQTGPAKKLNQGGGRSGLKLNVGGKKATIPIKKNAGYDEYEYTLKVDKFEVTVRFIGPAYFLYKKKGSPPFSFTGGSKAAKYSSSDKNAVYVHEENSALSRLSKQLPDYVFRTVPGAEPLNIDQEDQGAFAQYESVQVRMRRTRLTSELIILIRFTEPEAISFENYMQDFLANFIREFAPIKTSNILIARGSAPSYEANEYWKKGKWIATNGPLKKFLRQNFPEDY